MMTRPGAEDFFSQNILPPEDVLSDDSSIGNNNSLYDYLVFDDTHSKKPIGKNMSYDNDTLSVPSLSDSIDNDSDSEDDDTDEPSVASLQSAHSSHSIRSDVCSTTDDKDILNADNLPLTFLQLRGISIGNFNMNGNFKIEAAIRLMFHYKLDILAIQEHTP